MNYQDVLWIQFKHNLTRALRHPNILFFAFVVPMFLYPLLLWFLSLYLSFEQSLAEKQECFIVLGSIPSEIDEQLLRQAYEKADGIQLLELSSRVTEDYLELNVLKDNDQVIFQTRGHGSQVQQDLMRNKLKREWAKVNAAYEELALAKLGYDQGLPFQVDIQDLNPSRDITMSLSGLFASGSIVLVMMLVFMPASIEFFVGDHEYHTYYVSKLLAKDYRFCILGRWSCLVVLGALVGVINIVMMIFSIRGFLLPLLQHGGVSELGFDLSFFEVGEVFLAVACLSLVLATIVTVIVFRARSYVVGQALLSPVLLIAIVPISLVLKQETETYLNYVPIANIVLWIKRVLTQVPISFSLRLGCLLSVLLSGIMLWGVITLFEREVDPC